MADWRRGTAPSCRGRPRNTGSGHTAAGRLVADPHAVRAELPDAIPEEVLLRVQTAAATALCRLGRIVATDDGMALAPDLPLDTELVHRQVCYALRPLAAGIAGTEGAALLAMTKLTSSGDAATVSAPAS